MLNRNMANSKTQIVGLGEDKDNTLMGTSPVEEDAATQSPRSTANSFNTSSVETPWSTCKSRESRDLHLSADEDDDSSSADDDASECCSQDDDYYAFLREFAGSYDAAGDGEEEEEDDESELGSQGGDAGLGLDAGSGQKGENSPVRKRSVSLHDAGSMLASKSSPSGRDDTLGSGKTESPEDSDAASDTDDEELPYDPQQTRGNPGDGSSTSSLAIPGSEEYPSPLEDDYDVVKATQDYAMKRSGDRRQQWCEDMQEAIRLKKMQAHSLSKTTTNPKADPKLRAHYSRVRFELIMQAKALEARFKQVIGDRRVSSERFQDPLFYSCSGTVR